MTGNEEIRRAAEMLRIAAKIIRDEAPHARAHYDGADCDGHCVAEDCEIVAAMIERDISGLKAMFDAVPPVGAIDEEG